MANIPGTSGYVVPNTYSRVRTIRRSVSIPGGLRILAIMGLGERPETLILNAEGGGADGVNPNYTGSSTPDGRHFVLSRQNVIKNRTTLLLNGIPLRGLQEDVTSDPFDGRYDYRIETETGRIELQRASLVDQGGTFTAASSSNIGDGSVSVALIDANAPTETWTLRVTSVIRDAYGDPVAENATFTATGSVSGQPLDAYGAPIVFLSDGAIRDNGILRLTITEGSVPFDRSDKFTIKVASKVLVKGQTLEARYIAEEDVNDPEFFTDANALFQKHGFPSVSNSLSLGSQMAFENGAFGILAVQAKPALPRRTSEVVLTADDPLSITTEGFPPIGAPVTSADIDAFRYPLLNGQPDVDTSVNIFQIDRDSGVETQLFPTKVAFYDATITADAFNNFIKNANYSYSYTVILDSQVEDEGNDGKVTLGSSVFTAASAAFADFNIDEGEEGTLKQIRIFNRDEFGNDTSDVAGTFDIVSVGDGSGDSTKVTLNAVFGLAKSNLRWELLDAADKSARVLLTSDLAVSGAIRIRDGIRVTYIDHNDADFYDANWGAAYEKLESVNAQIIVPLPDTTFSAVQQAGRTHVELMSNTANQRERVLLIGAQPGVTAAALTGDELVAVEDIGVIEGIQGDSAEEVLAGNIEDLQNFSIADNFGTTFRVMYFFPDQIVRAVNGTRVTLPGFYMAAAVGGLLAATPNVAIPLTRKIITGFTITRDRTYKPLIQNALGNAGVALVTPVVGGGQIVHGKTTTASGAPEEEEASIIFIRDKVASTLRDVLRGFVGQPEDPTLVAGISTVASKTLQAFISQGLITAVRNLGVSRDDVDSRQFNVSVEIQPVFPVNWIFIDIGVGVGS